MPAFLTHWHVLIETARRSQDAGSDLGSLVIDAGALRRRLQGLAIPPQTTPAGAVWETGPLPEIDFRFPGSDISAMAYLGALAPDMTYFYGNNWRDMVADRGLRGQHIPAPFTSSSVRWADLLHTNRSGDMLLAFLEFIADVPSPALRSQALAFAMGYLSHIAADIALNPCINALAAAYDRSAVMGVFSPLGMHFYVELCLDEYIASVYFNRPRYTWTNQPWWLYIEPGARSISNETTLSARILDLLTAAAEATYGLSEEQSKAFYADNLAGLKRLRRYLAGRGTFRFLIWRMLTRRRQGDPITATIVSDVREADTVTFEEVLEYAIRLSEHLCRRAISYYAALRNTSAGANERSQRRALLCDDLRNWHLDTGHALDVTFDEDVTIHVLHNWAHFAELWGPDAETVRQMMTFVNRDAGNIEN